MLSGSVAPELMTQGTAPLVRLSELRPGIKLRDPDASLLSTLLTAEAIEIRENAESIRRRPLDLTQRVEPDRFQLAIVSQLKRGSYPSEHMPGGAMPIDYPGFGSPADQNTHTGYEFLPRLDDLNAALKRHLQNRLSLYASIGRQWLPDFESSLARAAGGASANFLQATNDVLESLRKTAPVLFGAELSSLQTVEELPVMHGDPGTNLVTRLQAPCRLGS
jgi:hypothetical protein